MPIELKLPILIFLSVICIISLEIGCGPRWGTDMDNIFRAMLIFIFVGLLLTIIDNKFLIMFYRGFIIGVGFFTVFASLSTSGYRTWYQVSNEEPFDGYLDHCPRRLNWLDLILFELGRLIFNTMIIVTSVGHPWPKHEDNSDERDVWKYKILFITIKLTVISLVVTACLSFATIIASLIFNFDGPNIFEMFNGDTRPVRLIWITIFFIVTLIEFFMFGCYFRKKIVNDITESAEKNCDLNLNFVSSNIN